MKTQMTRNEAIIYLCLSGMAIIGIIFIVAAH